MKKIKRMIAGLGVILVTFLALSGCGKEEGWEKWTATQMAVEKDGTVICCIVDSFEKQYYDIDELTGMVVKEAAEFNGKNKQGAGTPVTVLDVSRLEGAQDLVRVTWKFEQAKYYALFQNETMYYETLEEAVNEKHVFKGAVLTGQGGSLTIDDDAVKKHGTKHVLITNAKTVIHLPHDVLYYGSGAMLQKDGSVDLRASSDEVIMILSK